MNELSPAAKAILDAYRLAPIEDELTAAAVLRMTAELVAPLSTNRRQDEIRFKILRIALELEDLHADANASGL